MRTFLIGFIKKEPSKFWVRIIQIISVISPQGCCLLLFLLLFLLFVVQTLDKIPMMSSTIIGDLEAQNLVVPAPIPSCVLQAQVPQPKGASEPEHSAAQSLTEPFVNDNVQFVAGVLGLGGWGLGGLFAKAKGVLFSGEGTAKGPGTPKKESCSKTRGNLSAEGRFPQGAPPLGVTSPEPSCGAPKGGTLLG